MNTLFNKKKIAATLLGGSALLTAGAAQSAPIDFIFNTANIVGATAPFHSVTADEITLTSVGLSNFTFTDTSAPFGVVGLADDFVEFGLTSAVNFQNNNSNVFGTGINVDYELIADFSIFGKATVDVLGNVKVTFLPGSGSIGNLYYDETLDSAITAGASLIGVYTEASGDCVITAGTSFTEGSCKLNFAFDKGGVSDPGAFTYNGIDLGLLDASTTIDINGNNIATSSPLPNYPVGGTTITGQLDHDGSQVFNVPEPESLLLLSVGLLAGGMVQRRRNM